MCSVDVSFSRELEYNNLTELNKGWLYGLHMLRILRVNQNNVGLIRADAWEFCHRLEELWVTSVLTLNFYLVCNNVMQFFIFFIFLEMLGQSLFFECNACLCVWFPGICLSITWVVWRIGCFLVSVSCRVLTWVTIKSHTWEKECSAAWLTSVHCKITHILLLFLILYGTSVTL